MPSLVSRPLPSSPLSLTPDGLVPGSSRGALWYSDGDLIVIAGNKAWKVMRGLVRHRSGLLRDLLKAVRDDAPRIEDCTVVHVSDIVPEDVEEMLMWLHDGICLPDFRRHDSMGDLQDFLELSAHFRAWFLFFDAIRPLAFHYRNRLEDFVSWDRTHSLPRPIDPVIALHTLWKARRALEKHGGYRAGEDAESDHLFQVIAAGVRLDLSLYNTEVDLHEPFDGTREPLHKPTIDQAAETDCHRELRIVHEQFTKAFKFYLETFGEHSLLPSEHMRCCGDQVKKMGQRILSIVDASSSEKKESEDIHFLEIVRAVQTDSARVTICRNCLKDLDAISHKVYDEWWRKLSPLIRGLCVLGDS